ncbi:hypothetical protein JCM15831A_07130 [Asaia astilbis]
MRFNKPARVRVDEGAAASCENFGRALQQALDDPSLTIAKSRFAVPGEDLGDGASCGAFDLLICVYELQAEPTGQASSYRRLPGTH